MPLSLKRFAPLAVKCRFSKGLFSSERAFTITLADGTEYNGPAPIHFCWNASGKPLQKDEAIDDEIDGFVAGLFVIRVSDTIIGVEVPDGEHLAVDERLVTERPGPIVLSGSVVG